MLRLMALLLTVSACNLGDSLPDAETFCSEEDAPDDDVCVGKQPGDHIYTQTGDGMWCIWVCREG